MAIKTVQVTINGVPTTLTLNSSTGKYEATITAPAKSSYNQSGGYYNVTVKATDTAGNSTSKDATDATLGSKLKSVTFKVDTVPPTLNVTSPAEGLVTNNATVTVKGTTNDATSSPVTVKVNETAVTVDASGNFSTTVTLTEGSNTITVVATDSAGKATTVTRKVTLDTKAPTITDVSITPNPVDGGKTFVIAVSVTD